MTHTLRAEGEERDDEDVEGREVEEEQSKQPHFERRSRVEILQPLCHLEHVGQGQVTSCHHSLDLDRERERKREGNREKSNLQIDSFHA